MVTKTKNFKRMALAALAALSLSTSGLESRAAPVSVSGDVSYFAAEEGKSSAPNAYAEINYSAKLPKSTKVSGFIDLYNENNGYFAKTVGEKSLTDRLSLRTHVTHVNESFSQAGLGLSYVLPTPAKTFAKVSFLPLWRDSKTDVDNKAILSYFVCQNLPFNSQIFSFGEINVAAKDGPQWAYGEIELAKKFGNFTVGPNIQLNNNGAGKMAPEVIPRIAVRAQF